MIKLLTLSMLTILIFGGVAQAGSPPHDYLFPYWDAAAPNASGSEGNSFFDGTASWHLGNVTGGGATLYINNADFGLVSGGRPARR